jgi:hypothetical protein
MKDSRKSITEDEMTTKLRSTSIKAYEEDYVELLTLHFPAGCFGCCKTTAQASDGVKLTVVSTIMRSAIVQIVVIKPFCTVAESNCSEVCYLFCLKTYFVLFS